MLHRSPRLISYTVDQRRHFAGLDANQAGRTRRYAPITVEQAREAIAAYDAAQQLRPCDCDVENDYCDCPPGRPAGEPIDLDEFSAQLGAALGMR